MNTTPTPWTTVEDLREFASITRDVPDSAVQFLIASATDILYYHSAQQFNNGITEVIRPCKQPTCMTITFGFYPSNSLYGPGGPWPGQPGGLSWSCSCSTMQQFELDHGPLLQIDQILIDGSVFSPSNYHVDDDRWVVRTDGNPWPQCQFLDLPVTQPGTWQITYTWGVYTPEIGVLACQQLAAEMTKAKLGERCQIPPRTTRMIRQGMTIQMQDIKNEEERTGLYFVDLFLRTYNPQALRSQPYVWSPDLPSRGRRTTF